MSNKTAKIVNLVYALIMSLAILACALLLIWAALDIYGSGDRPYTPESIGAHFAMISPALYSSMLLAAGGVLIHIFLPAQETKLKGEIPLKLRHSKMMKRLYAKGCSGESFRRLNSKRNLRYALTSIGAVLYISGAVLALRYVADKDNFPALDANAEVLAGAIAVAICMALPFAYSIALSFISNALLNSELKIIKEELAADGEGEKTEPKAAFPALVSAKALIAARENGIILISRCVLISLAAALIIAGAMNGGAGDVLGKAIKICTECIGLG